VKLCSADLRLCATQNNITNKMMLEPNESNGFQAAHAMLLLDSYRQLTGRNLLPAGQSPESAAHDLYFAPFVVLSHDTAPDPVFTYANLTAQKLFAMLWQEIVGLPSRLSAEPGQREDRQRLLQLVTSQGYMDDYRGVRIASTGKRFEIRQATVWNLTSRSGERLGQAATFSKWCDPD